MYTEVLVNAPVPSVQVLVAQAELSALDAVGLTVNSHHSSLCKGKAGQSVCPHVSRARWTPKERKTSPSFQVRNEETGSDSESDC